MNLILIQADYSDIQQAKVLNEYACHPMGRGKNLNDYSRRNLIAELSIISNIFSILCYNNNPLGLANCLLVFPTIKCWPIINIFTHSDHQAKQIG